MKQALRKELLVKRRVIAGKPAKGSKDAAIFAKVFTLPEFACSDTVLTYVALPKSGEVDTLALIRRSFELGKRVAVPVIVDEKMRFFEIDEAMEDIGDEITRFENTVCITPGLAFNHDGYRLGYGGGYYDRFLAANRVFAIGLCYGELLTALPREPHDMRVDIVITD
ncbi:MAG: 5-formyltetrahydrofolate cyclo-ligase [Oscillospiraceae bacterium]|nr:5-formyltetrahydrofolate cyclo-ligase [Oscillospiraceae bacterium]